jgi:hypothetical protein
MLKNKRFDVKITPKLVEKVLHYFYNNHDNRSSVIAKHLRIKTYTVDYILDVHLSYKKNAYIDSKSKHNRINKIDLRGNKTKVLVYDAITNEFIGKFKSLTSAENTLSLSRSSISRNLRGKNNCIIHHYKINKKYKYVRF